MVTAFSRVLPLHPLDESSKICATVSLDESVPFDSVADTEWLIRKAYADDPKKGFELLYRAYYVPLCSHVIRFVYGKEIAEDIVADVFYIFWQQQTHRQITHSFRAYLYTAVRHRAFKYLQREFIRENSFTDSSDLEVSSSDSTPDEIMQHNELYWQINQVINDFSPQTQKVFLMSRFEGKAYKQIAEELQLSVKTIETHISKALGLLRKALNQGFILFLVCFFK